MDTATPVERRRFMDLTASTSLPKKPKDDPVRAYFKIVFWKPPTDEGNTYWFTFEVDGGGDDEFKKPLMLKPFSIAFEPPGTTVVGLGSVLYCLGGGIGAFSFDRVSFCDTSHTKVEWFTGHRMRAARLKPQAVVLDNKIYVFGGLDSNFNNCNFKIPCAEPQAWAEFYDPIQDEWKSLSVREHNGGPTDKTFQELLNPRYNNDPFERFSFLVFKEKDSDRNISIVTDKGTFSYDVINQTLKTVKDFLTQQLSPVPTQQPLVVPWLFGGWRVDSNETDDWRVDSNETDDWGLDSNETLQSVVSKVGITMEEDKVGIPDGFRRQLPPMVIDDWAYYVEESYGEVCRYSIVDKVEEYGLMNFWDKLDQSIPHDFPPDVHVFRTDGLCDRANVARMMHVFYDITPFGYPVEAFPKGDPADVLAVVCYTTASVAAEIRNKYLGVCIPNRDCYLEGCGILL